ncbi:MAG: amino acid adenylation domain-containing protein, partial [bacterium]|nr:amino acid adenylation domain-containing protein [bacterium]
YNTKLFFENTIHKFINYFKKIVPGVLDNKDIRIWEIEIISKTERRQLLYDFNDTAARYPKDQTIHRLFETRVERVPDNIVIIGPVPGIGKQNMYLTYNRLNKVSGQLAHLLIGKGVKPGTIVGILVERSIEMVIGILGTLKAGGAYLPIDIEYPDDRISYMLKDSNAEILLTDLSKEMTHAKDIVRVPDAINLSRCRAAVVPTSNVPPTHPLTHSPTQLCYIIYTSGSTGNPKGVMVEHRGLVNYIKWAEKVYLQEKNYDFPLYSSLAVDLTVTSLYLPLISGNKIIIYKSGKHEDVISRVIRENKVQVIKLTPTHLKIARNLEIQESCIKILIVGGEELSAKLASEIYHKFQRRIVIYNEYGPTETVVGCMIYKFNEESDKKKSVPIGTPAANTSIYILDQYLNPVPPGVTGEIYIAGDGVARGYLNNPELSAEKFRKATLSPNDQCPVTKNRLYRTGDLARRLENGNIEFLGRIDHQVKIRGFRIELGEIENRLLDHEKIKEAVVLSAEDESGDRCLCAYMVLAVRQPGQGADLLGLREYLLQFLPGYMIPSYFIHVEEIPLTLTGKIDRRALPEPGTGPYEETIAPRDEIERKLVEIWTEVLSRDVSHASQLRESIGIAANFFQMGGHSLKAATLASRVHKVFQVKLPLMEIFKRPTIRRLAQYIKEAVKEQFFSIEVTEKKQCYVLSSAQKRLYFLHQIDSANTVYNIPSTWLLEGNLHKDRLEQTFIRLIQRHESLRTSFRMVGEEPVQKIHHEVEFKIVYYCAEGKSATHLSSDFIRSFDLTDAPLLRVG